MRRLSLEQEISLLALLGLLLVALLVIPSGLLPLPLKALRLLLGLPYVLLVPGYILQTLAFPQRGDLAPGERRALSFGLSLALLPPLALGLDQLPWGFQAGSATIGLLLLILLALPLSLARRLALPPEQRFTVSLPGSDEPPKTGQPAPSSATRALLGVALATFLLTTVSIAALPKPGAAFTEFYLLNRQGQSRNYPAEVLRGQPLSAKLGVTNREGRPRRYRVELWAVDPSRAEGRRLLRREEVLLENRASREWTVSWTMPWEGAQQRVEFLLFQGQEGAPYRTLDLWLQVVEGG